MTNFTFEEERIINCYLHENRKTTIQEMENAIPYLQDPIKGMVIRTRNKLLNTSNIEYESLYKRLIEADE